MTISKEIQSEILALVVRECLKTPDGRATLKAGWDGFAAKYSNSPAGVRLKNQQRYAFYQDVSRHLELPDVFALKDVLEVEP